MFPDQGSLLGQRRPEVLFEQTRPKVAGGGGNPEGRGRQGVNGGRRKRRIRADGVRRLGSPQYIYIWGKKDGKKT